MCEHPPSIGTLSNSTAAVMTASGLFPSTCALASFSSSSSSLSLPLAPDLTLCDGEADAAAAAVAAAASTAAAVAAAAAISASTSIASSALAVVVVVVDDGDALFVRCGDDNEGGDEGEDDVADLVTTDDPPLPLGSGEADVGGGGVEVVFVVVVVGEVDEIPCEERRDLGVIVSCASWNCVRKSGLKDLRGEKN